MSGGSGHSDRVPPGLPGPGAPPSGVHRGRGRGPGLPGRADRAGASPRRRRRRSSTRSATLSYGLSGLGTMVAGVLRDHGPGGGGGPGPWTVGCWHLGSQRVPPGRAGRGPAPGGLPARRGLPAAHQRPARPGRPRPGPAGGRRPAQRVPAGHRPRLAGRGGAPAGGRGGRRPGLGPRPQGGGRAGPLGPGGRPGHPRGRPARRREGPGGHPPRRGPDARRPRGDGLAGGAPRPGRGAGAAAPRRPHRWRRRSERWRTCAATRRTAARLPPPAPSSPPPGSRSTSWRLGSGPSAGSARPASCGRGRHRPPIARRPAGPRRPGSPGASALRRRQEGTLAGRSRRATRWRAALGAPGPARARSGRFGRGRLEFRREGEPEALAQRAARRGGPSRWAGSRCGAPTRRRRSGTPPAARRPRP